MTRTSVCRCSSSPTMQESLSLSKEGRCSGRACTRGRLSPKGKGARAMSPFASTLFYVGVALMLLDAALYSLGAIRPLREGIKTPNAYWDRRLLLNLLLANMGLYFTALFTLIGAFLARSSPGAAQPLLLLSIIVCLYSGVSVPLLTPRDWPHTLPRVLAAVLIGIGLLIR